MGSLSKKISRLFGSTSTSESSEENTAENNPDDLTSIITPLSDGFERYIAAGKTAPEYETPILGEEAQRLIANVVGSTQLMSFDRFVFPPFGADEHLHFAIETHPHDAEPEGLRVLTIELRIENIEDWASTSRWLDAGGEPDEILGLVGSYFVDLVNEIESCYGDAFDFGRTPLISFRQVEYDEEEGHATYRVEKNVSAYDMQEDCVGKQSD